MRRSIYVIKSIWDTVRIDVLNRLRRMTGEENFMTHTLPFKERLEWRMYLYDSTRD